MLDAAGGCDSSRLLRNLTFIYCFTYYVTCCLVWKMRPREVREFIEVTQQVGERVEF